MSETSENEDFILAENPYWHPEEKRHVFDPNKVEELCLIAFEAFATSRALYREFVVEDEEVESTQLTYPSLIGKHRDIAETRISSVLLTLAITYRALEEGLEEGKPLKQFIDKIPTDYGQMLVWIGDEKGKTSLREVCNKIIHANDIRFVYVNTYQTFYDTIWMMEGTIELEGILKKKPWKVSFVLPDFLEALLDISNFIAALNKEVSQND